tara:strand:+ start:235 stop:546 length:312 start_codon:yes stop_codon:yes gene_type:complete
MKKHPSNWIEGMAMELKSKRYSMKDPLQELLTITMEECGELIQQCSKAIRCDTYRDNEKLTEEVGDVMCMLELLHEYDLISWEDVYERVEVKKKKLKRWSNLL